MSDPPPHVVRALARLIGSPIAFQPVGDPQPWSATWLVRGDGPPAYLKATPRSRPESLVVSAMSRLAPDLVPQVVAGDLDPHSPTRWFVLDDAGACDRDPLTLASAAGAARVAGALQRRCAGDQELVRLLPGCMTENLHDLALGCCRWAQAGEWQAEDRAFLRSAESRLGTAIGGARRVAGAMRDLAPTVVHGDLWAGNIARAGHIRLVDWGDAFWGTGTVDVVNLVVCRPAPFDPAEAAELWRAFEEGWEDEIDEGARRASVVAHTVASLVGDRRIAESIGRPPQWLRGIVPGLRGLLSELDAWRPAC